MTVVDPEIFEVWKDEAFSLWLSEWAALYNEESRSSELIHEIHNTTIWSMWWTTILLTGIFFKYLTRLPKHIVRLVAIPA